MAINPTVMIEKLQTALGSGVMKITVDGEEITYGSFNEIRQRIRYFEAMRDAPSSQTQTAAGTSYAEFERD